MSRPPFRDLEPPPLFKDLEPIIISINIRDHEPPSVCLKPPSCPCAEYLAVVYCSMEGKGEGNGEGRWPLLLALFGFGAFFVLNV